MLNIFGAVLVGLGLLGFAVFLIGYGGEGAAALSGGAVPMMLIQTQGMIISATLLIVGVVIWCTGTRKP
jgi:hypothetical protein